MAGRASGRRVLGGQAVSARGRLVTAAALLAVCLTVAAVYVMLFTTASMVAVWCLGGAAAAALTTAMAPLVGGGQVRRPEDEAELEPLPHPERYQARPPVDAGTWWLYGPGGAAATGRTIHDTSHTMNVARCAYCQAEQRERGLR